MGCPGGRRAPQKMPNARTAGTDSATIWNSACLVMHDVEGNEFCLD
jgi:hypothetical protein